MTIVHLLQIDFKMKGPFGDEMAKEFSDLAKSINVEDGFIWKIWTENAQKNEDEGEIIIYTIGSRPVYSLVITLLHQAFPRLNDEEKAMSTLRLVQPVSCHSYLISSRPTLLLSHYLCNQRLYHAE